MKLWNEKAKLVCGEKRKKQMCIKRQTWTGHVEKGRGIVQESWLLSAFNFLGLISSTVARVTGLQATEQKRRMKNCLLLLFPEKSYGPGSP